MNDSTALAGIGRQLVAAGLLDERIAVQARDEAARHQLSLVQHLVQQRLVAAREIAELAAGLFGMPLLDLRAFDPAHLPRELVGEKLVRRHRALPLLRRGNRLFVGLADPGNQQALKDIQFATGLQVEAVLVEDDQLGEIIEQAFGSTGNVLAGLDEVALDELASDQAQPLTSLPGSDAEDAPVVRFVNRILLEAIRSGSSDLHFEPYEKLFRVRLRTDGILHEIARPPVRLAGRIAARLKVMAGLDISERRKPQDGRLKLKVSTHKAIDFRVNSLPTLWGEKIVMRILDPSSAQMGIDALGYEDDQKALYLQALRQPQGMILVTGPTGSGKTVSLYTGLNILNTPDVNISTAEDPVEINLEGINQVNVNPRQGMDFAQALRAFLRQDPDVIMVGEIRDLETAEIAIKAAQTGHMVMSTLHTNSAAETLTRLRNMGVPAFNIATSVNLIIAQRLARRLCPQCRKPHELPEEALLREGFPAGQIGRFRLYRPAGCMACNGGYRGRVGLYEVVRITPALQQLIMQEGNALEIAAQARAEGFADLRAAGLLKAMQGLTSLEEINRVTRD